MNIDPGKFIAGFKRLIIMREFGMYPDTKISEDFEEKAMAAYRNDFGFALEINATVGHTLALLEQYQIEDN